MSVEPRGEGTGAGSLAGWPGHTGNWGRWTNDLGTLNLITPAVVKRGLAAAIEGKRIVCGRPITGVDPFRDEPCFDHQMLTAGAWDLDDRVDSLNSSDRVSFRVHGMVNTHLDAFAHVGYQGKGFNGRPFAEMVSKEGVAHGPISNAVGIMTRGVLIDVARKRGVDYLSPGDFVRPEELRELEATVDPGDAVLIRLGGTLAGGSPPDGTGDSHGIWPGLHPDCIDVLGKMDISLVGTDSGGDVYPSPYSSVCRSPVHTLCLTYYGIHLLHNLDLERLATECAQLGRNTFLFTVSPLYMSGATGSLVTPLAVL